MKKYVVGASIGEYQGNSYGRIHTLEPFAVGSNGIGSACVAEKTSVEVARLIDEVNCVYDLEFNRYGRVVGVKKLSEEQNEKKN